MAHGVIGQLGVGGINAGRGEEFACVDGEVGRRKTEAAPQLLAGNHAAVDGVGPAEHRGGFGQESGGDGAADVRRTDALEYGRLHPLQAEIVGYVAELVPREEAAVGAEGVVIPHDDGACAVLVAQPFEPLPCRQRA